MALATALVGCGGAAGDGVDGGGGADAAPCTGDGTWIDISSAQIDALGGASSQSYPGGVSGVVVDRFTGEVTAHIVGFGLWRSADRGATWTRIDQMALDPSGGRSETGWSVQVDQDAPERIAVFTLDGAAGYTADGVTWHRWTDSGWGRNWDFGAVDWSASTAQTVFGVLHETTPRNVYELSTDGGAAWSAMDTGKVAAMVGVAGATTLVATRTTGIERSTDLGAHWTAVSDVKPEEPQAAPAADATSPSAVQFQRLVLCQGVDRAGKPIAEAARFNEDDVRAKGLTGNAFDATGSFIYKTADGGATWTKVVDIPAASGGFPISLSWYGSFAWDPRSDTYYASSMSNPLLRLDCLKTADLTSF